MERYKVACTLRQTIGRDKILSCVKTWFAGITKHPPLEYCFAESSGDFLKIARAASAASAARAAWAAWDARDASWELSWVSIIAIGALSRSDEETFKKWLPLFEAFESGAYCIWITDDVCMIAEIPTVHIDDRRRLHCESGPAFSWLSDIRDYYWHGVLVPKSIILQPETITSESVNAEKNTEVRRVMIERFPGGQSAYLQASGATKVHEDDYGVLYRQYLPDDEPLVMVKVVNSTPEPDGTFKDYFIRVPPTMKTAREAVAWTFSKLEDQYEPAIQT